jgi:hypothetical protein
LRPNVDQPDAPNMRLDARNAGDQFDHVRLTAAAFSMA